TKFSVEFFDANFDGKTISISSRVKNIGSVAGKEVVQIYAEAPQGKLGKAARVLAAFKKTSLLQSGQEETISLSFEIDSLASYDDCGASGNEFCRVLETGEYFFYGGTDVSSAQKISFGANDSVLIENQIVVEKLDSALAPINSFKRIKVGEKLENRNYKIEWEDVPRRKYDLAKRIEKNSPKEIPFTGNDGIKFCDVLSGKKSQDEFIAQLNDEELATLVRGEGMASRKVTAGVASAFGGVSHALYEYGVPVASCADGPSGVRMDTGKEASLMPIGTLLACTWNPILVEELMRFEGEEIRANNVDTILGPGINIHRNPLGGRNFEYFSEDPLLTGMMTLATIRGIASIGA
ncbi:MAG: fibronectin type III-like domain-contianing protein, partial [Treponemataceae bacterium]|nr:fibronectin type III-like domain-contianing protein [Treponemataceae bacterium]